MKLPTLVALTFTILSLFSLDSQTFGQSRWRTTATNGSGLSQGDATTITWGFVQEGTAINPAFSGESSDPSSLIGFLDNNNIGGSSGSAGGSDLTQRPWFNLFEDIFDRWDAVSGLSFQYEANDSGARLGSVTGSLGVNADVRIGGHSIDGQSGSNTLAYNYFPNNGDMVIDTDNVAFYSNSNNNYIGLRNVLSHEFGHGMGISHFESNNSRGLMEPFINTTFDGPQIDDIHQAQRRYGDRFEEAGGNDAVGSASSLGIFTGTDLAVGSDAVMEGLPTEVMPDQVDFVSIDGTSDTDVWSFQISSSADIALTLDMVGASYNRGPQGGTQSAFSLSEQSDLDLELIASDGVTILGTSALNGLNVTEQILASLNAGTYYARVTGRTDAAQFYELRLSGTFSAVPEPSATVLLGGLLMLACGRRRR